MKSWEKVTKKDIREIVKIEPPTKAEILVKFAFKTAFLGKMPALEGIELGIWGLRFWSVAQKVISTPISL